MKTIEDWISDEVINYDWEMNGFGDMAIKELLEKGAKRGILEALRWRDPINEPPESNVSVFVKYETATGKLKYGVGRYFPIGLGNPWTVEGSTSRQIIGWRPIE